jgi:hypothetical protein
MLAAMRTLVPFVALILALDAAAQPMPGRGRGGSPREAGRARLERPQDAQAAIPGDPFSALERELPSLEVDLALKAEHLDAWRVFSRDVRDIAEMDRARRKHLTSLREGGERPPTAGTFIAALAEDERLRFEAVNDLKRHFEQLYGALDEAQRRTIDRRVIQSQVEPLGR